MTKKATIKINIDEAVIKTSSEIADACIGIMSGLVGHQLRLLIEIESALGVDDRGFKIEDEESEIIAKLRYHIDQLSKLNSPNDAETAMRTIKMVTAFPAMLSALEMVRDADEDCKRDGLQTMPNGARAAIDRAIKAATAE